MKFTSIEYNDQVYNILKKELKNEGITLSCKTSNNISKITKPPRHNDDKYKLTGVYKITFSDCPCHYYGQTGRSFEVRMAEHLPKPRLNEQKSSFAQHLIDENHSVSSIQDNMDIIHVCQKSKKMDVLEEYCIFKGFKTSPNNVLNDKLNFKSNAIFNVLLDAKLDERGNNNGSDSQQGAERHDSAGIPPDLSTTWLVRRM